MIIYTMRHGEAEPYKADDKSRVLTAFGESQAKNAGKWIAKQQQKAKQVSSIEVALVSPYVRTQQTLEHLSAHVDIQTSITSDLITPMGKVQEVHDFIDGLLLQQPQLQSLLLVTHMPLVSLLSDHMCSGFNGRIFDTADILMMAYEPHTSAGTLSAYYQSKP